MALPKQPPILRGDTWALQFERLDEALNGTLVAVPIPVGSTLTVTLKAREQPDVPDDQAALLYRHPVPTGALAQVQGVCAFAVPATVMADVPPSVYLAELQLVTSDDPPVVESVQWIQRVDADLARAIA